MSAQISGDSGSVTISEEFIGSHVRLRPSIWAVNPSVALTTVSAVTVPAAVTASCGRISETRVCS